MSEKLKKIIGYPSKEDVRQFKLLFGKLRLLISVYIVIMIIYLVFFILCLLFSDTLFANYFGNGFGLAVSASVFSSLFMFVFFTLAVSVISIRISTTTPEEYKFDDRLRAIINAKNVKKEEEVFSYLKSTISSLLAYNKYIKYEVYVTHYYPETKIICLVVNRTQVSTNMCKDKDFESPNSKITISTDAEVKDSFGKITFLGRVDPNNFNTVIDYKINNTNELELKSGKNVVEYETGIKEDSEIAISLKYSAFQKIKPKTELESWSFCTASKYCPKIEFSITNNVKGLDLKIDVRRRGSNQQLSDIAIEEKLTNLKSFKTLQINPFFPTDRIEFYIEAI